jgi:hypothetical protein
MCGIPGKPGVTKAGDSRFLGGFPGYGTCYLFYILILGFRIVRSPGMHFPGLLKLFMDPREMHSRFSNPQ